MASELMVNCIKRGVHGLSLSHCRGCGTFIPVSLARACKECDEIRTKNNGFGPSHDGSRSCESGSIASGRN